MDVMRIFLFILLTFASGVLFSQKSERSRQQYVDTSSTGILSINVSPLCLLDLYNGAAYRFGIQFRPVQQISIGGDAGGYVESVTKFLTNLYDIHGYHTRIRLAHYPEDFSNFSFGIEYQFKQQKFSYMDSTETEPAFEAKVSKKVHGYNLFVAFDHNFSDHFFLEFQFGVGVRYRDIFNTRSDVVGDSSYAFPWDSMTTGRVTTGKNFLPNITLAIRIGYSIFKN